MTSYLKYGSHVCLFVHFPDRKLAHLEAYSFFVSGGDNEGREKQGGG